MQNERIAYLFQQLMSSRATPEEQAELRTLLITPENKDLAQQLIQNAFEQDNSHSDVSPEVRKAMLEVIFQSTGYNPYPIVPTPKEHGTLKRITIAAAAILLVALATTLYFYSAFIVNRNSAVVNDIAPGYNQATLTLADGTKVNLDSTKTGIQISDEDISYNDGAKIKAAIHHSASITYNSLITPKGGQYQIILSDGTKVWLNAASTLKYPSRFSGGRREVYLEGEGYFAVAKSGKHKAKSQEEGAPFIVKSKNQETVVLGTEFNIDSYESTVKTTLVTGAVEVASHTGPSALTPKPYTLKLSPGEQSILSDNTLTKAKADIETVTAWRDGLFSFNDEPLESVMKKIARWYNVEIVYGPGVNKQDPFGGSISRYEKVSSILRKLELTGGITFRVEKERRIIVEKNP